MQDSKPVSRLSWLASPRVLLVGVGLVIVGMFIWIVGWSPQPAVATGVGGLAVLTAAALSFYGNTVAHEETVKARMQAHEREVLRDLRSRFTTSAEQLSAEEATTRLAGVYSLASLADDWYSGTGSTLSSERDRQVCIDVLCAYLRRDTMAYPVLYAQLEEGEIVGRTDDLRAEEMIVRDAIVSALQTHTTAVPAGTKDPSWRGAVFDLTRAKLKAANLHSADLATSLLGGADLTKAMLIGARLDGCNLDGTTLTDASLNGAKLTGSQMNKAHLDGTQLTSTNFQNSTGRGADFTGARGDMTNFRGARLHSAKFTGSRMMGARFDGADLYDANFEGASLTHACFDGATIDGADFRGVDLTTASFKNVVIRWDAPVWPDGERPDHVTVAPLPEFPNPDDD